MPILQRVFRLMLVSAASAAVIAGAWFAVLMLAWWYIPPITDLSPRLVASPQHALGFAACIFALVFGFLFVVGFPESVVRPMLFGDDELPRSGRHSGEN
jgi:hypothetical protein